MATGWVVLIVFGCVLAALLIIVAFMDITQKKHAILRNFPIVGHFRYWLELVGPELRQYIVTSNTEERPFNRDQRRWIYASAKSENNYFGYGSDQEMELSPNYLIIKQSAFPLTSPTRGQPGFDPTYSLPCAKVMGAKHGRAKAFRPASVVNISGMSFGSLSANAVIALNSGAKIAGCMQSTGEGSLSPHHKQGGDLIWQLGTGYFGARTPDGRFDIERVKAVVAANPVKAIEVKLSQGAKPGIGGLLPGVKVTKEIAEIRGIEQGKDCHSPAAHTQFHDVDGLIEFVEMLATETGLPIGIKSAVGDMVFWEELAAKMAKSGRGVDFITIDGGEGGTGAGPLVFSDHVAMPFKIGFTRVYKVFAEAGVAEDVVFIGSGKLGFPAMALMAFAVGCDMINVGREAMMAIGCIQAQRCHTDRCPTGVATQDKWLMRGLDPENKAPRLANYVLSLRKELLSLSHACGELHPALVSAHHVEILDDHFTGTPVGQMFGYQPMWGLPKPEEREAIRAIMAAKGKPADEGKAEITQE